MPSLPVPSRWLFAGGLLAAVALGLWRPPLALWSRGSSGVRGISHRLLLSVLHTEARGQVSARQIEGFARLVGSLPQGNFCENAVALGKRRFTRNQLAATLLAEDIVGSLRRGARGTDRLGIEYLLRPEEPGCSVALPADDEGERQGAAFARYWKATASREAPARQAKTIVLHVTNGTVVSALAWFQRPGARTSAHYLVRSSDGMIVQMVDERRVAFHDACFNEESIGIEHEGMTQDGTRWFSEAMYRASARLVRDIARRHQIPLDRAHVIGHNEAPDCSEHDDPGPSWDWALYWRLVEGAEEPRGG